MTPPTMPQCPEQHCERQACSMEDMKHCIAQQHRDILLAHFEKEVVLLFRPGQMKDVKVSIRQQCCSQKGENVVVSLVYQEPQAVEN